MEKVSVGVSNNFCPQTLFVYGTYKEDGTPDFGLFCWFSYCWNDGLGVMACIGGEKLTKDRIRATGVFSANLVTETLLPLADYYGNNDGRNPAKMAVLPAFSEGEKLHVPVLCDSPWSYELEVAQTVALNGSDIFICRIRNILADKRLVDDDKDIAARLKTAAPIITTAQTYFNTGSRLGSWGEWKDRK